MTDATMLIRLNRISRMLRNRDRSMPLESWLDLCSGHVERLMREVAGVEEAGPPSAFVVDLAERLGRHGAEVTG
jgi:ribonucleotide monophosphatase NagD (HAD superfamily)